MIKRLHVLNGTESHDFEVGKRYIHFTYDQVVKEILVGAFGNGGYRVVFEDGSHVDVITNNALVFNS